MIKTYQLTIPARNTSFILRGKTNNSMRYNFGGGDPLTGKAATIMLRSQYAQDLLEESEEFKKGLIILVRTDEGGEEVKDKKKEVTVMEDITSTEQLIEFVAENLEKVFKQPKAALTYAEKAGYKFPNLDIDKD